jgi:hypothetical protein
MSEQDNTITVETPEAAPPVHVLSNVSLVRDPEGKVNVYVGNEKVLGIVNTSMGPLQGGEQLFSFAIPTSRVRFGEIIPPGPIVQSRDNVVSFDKFRAYQTKKEENPEDEPA